MVALSSVVTESSVQSRVLTEGETEAEIGADSVEAVLNFFPQRAPHVERRVNFRSVRQATDRYFAVTVLTRRMTLVGTAVSKGQNALASSAPRPGKAETIKVLMNSRSNSQILNIKWIASSRCLR